MRGTSERKKLMRFDKNVCSNNEYSYEFILECLTGHKSKWGQIRLFSFNKVKKKKNKRGNFLGGREV